MPGDARVQTGVPGLDAIVGGGLPPGGSYLIMGDPGAGKTTLGLQFLVEGARKGERCLYVCLSETVGQLTGIAESFGWDLDGVDIHEMRRLGGDGGEGGRGGYTVFHPAEVELEEISRELLGVVERLRPTRLVVDSLSEIRLLAEGPGQYRRELLRISDGMSDGGGCTTLLIDVQGENGNAGVAETLAAGVFHLDQQSPAYGGERRRLRVRKLRASTSVGGYHDFKIGPQGLEIYPRLVAASHRAIHSTAAVPSGLTELDAMLGGGLDGGTSVVLVGPAGAGKSTVASQFVSAAAGRGDRAAMFCFDESPTNLLVRTAGLGLPLEEQIEAGLVRLVPVDPAEFTPGELSHRIRGQVESGARLIVLDSINGYMTSLPEERFLVAHLHELLAFLSEQGVVTLLTLAQHGLFEAPDAPVSISHVADTVVLFRYFEAEGEMRKSLTVVKKRTGRHERTARELLFGPDGLRIGKVLGVS